MTTNTTINNEEYRTALAQHIHNQCTAPKLESGKTPTATRFGRKSTITNEHLIDINGRIALDNLADAITSKTSYRVDIDYNKHKLTIKDSRLVARIYVTANHYRISNYKGGNGKVKQTVNSFEELLEKIS